MGHAVGTPRLPDVCVVCHVYHLHMANACFLTHPGKTTEWDCDYAHTLLELMYHPQVYKTGLCDHFDESDVATWRCVWKRR